MKIFYLPDLGEGLPEAQIREWLVKEGDEVTVDQPMVVMETAKALVEVPAPRNGCIHKRHGAAGDVISTGAPLVEFVNGQTLESSTVAGKLETAHYSIEESPAGIKPVAPTTHTVKALPAVRALAKRLNIDLTQVIPTGANQQITQSDVEKAANSQQTPLVGYRPLQGVRRVMAHTMQQSQAEVVPATVVDDAYLSDTVAAGDVTVAIIQAIIAGCTAEPSLNTWFDGKTNSRCLCQSVHLGLAIDSVEGLLVPVIKEANQLTKIELREHIQRLKQAVQQRTVKPDTLQGATFVLSNFGTFAGRYATPIVVPPTVAILGTGRLREEPSVKDGQVIIRHVLPLSLTFDHRAVTGGEAVRFLAAVIGALAGA